MSIQKLFKRGSTKLFLFVYIILAGLIKPVVAELQIDITQGTVKPMPIAISDLTGSTGQEKRIGEDIASVIAANLERSGLFKPLNKKSFIQKLDSEQSIPRFGDWRIINAQALVHGRSKILPDGRLRVEFRLWDVFAEKQMVGLAYSTQSTAWRRVAHIIADAVYKRITGESGYFDTRIVYIAERGLATKRIKKLAIMDQDGANHKFLTDGKNLVLTPRFSPNQQEIAYLSYYGNLPRVYLWNIDSGRQRVLGDFPGMTYAPRFSPDGKNVIMSMAKGGNSDVYSLELQSRKLKKLTHHSSIDTSPDYSPDGKQIVFNSDRGGSKQLYIMNYNGKGIRRISHGKGNYATPVWSPRGDLIAFTKSYRGKFMIGVMRTDGTGERILADGFLVESPTWSPNGRVLIYFSQNKSTSDGKGGRSKLFSVDLTGTNVREILTPLDASDPAWSPLIP